MAGHLGRRAAVALCLAMALPCAVHAAPAAQATQILFLGTGGGPPLDAKRSRPATLLIVNGRGYLIDCGIGTVDRLVDAGEDAERVGTIFFTHLHADHDLGIGELMATDFFVREATSQAPPVAVYGPPQTRELVDSAFRYISVGFRPFAGENAGRFPTVNGNFVNPFVVHEIAAGGPVFDDGNIRVTAVENSHYALMPAHERPNHRSYSYRIETPDGAIVFTGDTGPSEAVTDLSKGADVLIAEATFRDPDDLNRLSALLTSVNRWTPARTKVFRDHFEVEHLDAPGVGELASRAGAKAAILYHYNPVDEADQARFVEDVKAQFTGPVFAPDDLDRYCLQSGTLAPCPTDGTPQQ